MRFGRLVAIALLPGLLLVDLANGLVGEGAGVGGLPFSPGEAVRSLVVAGGVFLLATVRTIPIPAMRRWTVALGLLLGLSSLYGMTLGLDARDFMYDVSRIVKALYGPVMAVVFVWAVKRQGCTPRDLLRALAWFGAVAGGAVVASKITGVGALTYGSYSTAYKGLFLAQNDLGLAMGIALVAAVHLALLTPRRATPWTLVAITVAGMLTIGTRMGTVGAVVLPIAVMAIHFGRIRRWHQAMVAAPAAVAGLLFLTLVAALRVAEIRAEPYQIKRYESLGAGALTRVARLAVSLTYIESRPAVAQVIGEGAARYREGVAPLSTDPAAKRQAEIDWIDLFGAYGATGMIAIYGFYIATALRYRRARPRLGTPLAYGALVGIGVYLAHGTLAGHAMVDPLPSGAVAPWLALLWLGPSLRSPTIGRLPRVP